MAGNTLSRNGRPRSSGQSRKLRQGLVLSFGVGHVIRALQLDTDGKVIALFLALKAGTSGMPGTVQTTDELDNRSIPSDQRVSRHLQPGNGLKIRMGTCIEPVTEEVFDVAAAKFSRRQTDIMHHQQ